MTMGAAPSLRSVVAVTPVFNRRDLTLQCLASLFAGDRDGIALAAIVVDDGSSDGTAEAIAARFPDVEVIKGDGTLWYSEGTNVGVRAALKRSPDYILLHNNDSLFPSDGLVRLVACAEKHPTSLVGAALVKWDDGRTIFQTGTRWQTSYGGWRTIGAQTVDDLPDAPFPVETFAGNCVLVPAAAFDDAGLMASEALPNFGDSELMARMRRRGWRLLVEPAARVLCEPNALPRRLSSMSPRELHAALWSRRTSYHNLKQRHAANLGGAPSRWQGRAATAIFVGRLLLKSLGVSGSWPNGWPERRLRDAAVPVRDPTAHGGGDCRTVVYAWPYREWGGVQVYMLHLMQAAKAAGYRVAAAVPAGIPPLQHAMIAAAADTLWLLPDARDHDPAPTLRRKLARRRRNARADRAMIDTITAHAPPEAVIHIDAGPWDSRHLLRALLKRHPVVVTIHTGLQRLHGRHFRRWRRGFAAVAANPRLHLIAANGEARRSLAPYLPLERLDHVPISQASFDPEPIERALRGKERLRASLLARLALADTPIRIVVGAQFIERKGPRDLLHALRLLRERGVAVSCLWLAPNAPPPGMERLLADASHAGLLDLRLQSDLGPSHADYLAALAALADIFVLPSHLEGLPLALVEAMALGLPCVATAVNAVPEAVRHGRSGLLVMPQAPAELAAAIQRLVEGTAERRMLGANARRSAWERYALPDAAFPTLAVYSVAGSAA